MSMRGEGGGIAAAEVNSSSDEGCRTEIGGPALEGGNTDGAGEQGAARGSHGHAGGCQMTYCAKRLRGLGWSMVEGGEGAR